MNQTPHKVATGQDIRKILGPVDDEVVTDILRTSASANEISEAFEWLNDDDYMGAELKKPINDNIRRIYELLQSARDRFEQYER